MNIIDANIADGATIEVYWQDEVSLDVDVALMYVKSGQKEIDAYVQNVSKPDIDNYINTEAKPIVSEVVVDIAEPLVYEYIENTVKPDIDEFTNSRLDTYNSNAEEKTLTFNTDYDSKLSAFNANAEEKTAAVNAGAALATEQAIIATTQAETATTSALSASQSASNALASETNAKNSASEAALHNLKNKITNCITEIPQDIKLELNNGTVTLKAGSKVYIPKGKDSSGNNIFSEYTTSSDLSFGASSLGSTKRFVCYTNNSIICGAWEYFTSGTTVPSVGYYYHSGENKIYRDGAVVNDISLPLAIGDYVTQSGFSSIDQVFNGFGYVGSTIFALPGVKGLIPDGRNADGSLKNIETTVNKVAVLTFGSNVNTPYNGRFLLNSSGGIFARVGGYDPVRNYITASDGVNILSGCSFAEGCLVEAGVIKAFNSKLPFRAVDYNDFQQLASNTFSAGNIGDIKYTSRTDVPNGGAWCDGALYTKAQFPDVYQMLVAGKLQSITVSAFDSSVSANGSCGFFGLDTTNKRFKVPLLKDVYIKAGQAGEMFGAESLPNIKGLLTLAGTLPVASATETSSATGAFYGDGKDTAQKHDASPFIGGAGKYGFNASRSSSTYKDNAKVNPDHVTYRAYVVLYSSATEASVTQAAEFMTALGGKVNVNLDNVASNIDYVISSGKVSNGGWVIWKSGRIEQWGRVDYPSGVASGTNYTITLHKPYTSNYSLATDYVLEPSGWGKYSTVSRSLTNFAFRLDSSSGNLQASLRSFSWYTTGF